MPELFRRNGRLNDLTVPKWGGLSLCPNSLNLVSRIDFCGLSYTVIRVKGFYANLGKIQGRYVVGK